MEHKIDQQVYQSQGYEHRGAYLQSLADEHGVSIESVRAIADTFGPTEDFDGLPVALEDYSHMLEES